MDRPKFITVAELNYACGLDREFSILNDFLKHKAIEYLKPLGFHRVGFDVNDLDFRSWHVYKMLDHIGYWQEAIENNDATKASNQVLSIIGRALTASGMDQEMDSTEKAKDAANTKHGSFKDFFFKYSPKLLVLVEENGFNPSYKMISDYLFNEYKKGHPEYEKPNQESMANWLAKVKEENVIIHEAKAGRRKSGQFSVLDKINLNYLE